MAAMHNRRPVVCVLEFSTRMCLRVPLVLQSMGSSQLKPTSYVYHRRHRGL
jgi:hypothetical protein